MKKLSVLALVAEKHKDCLLQIYNGDVTVHTGAGNERVTVTCKTNDNEVISCIIDYLNYGVSNEIKVQGDKYSHLSRPKLNSLRAVYRSFRKLLEKAAHDEQLEIKYYPDDNSEFCGTLKEYDGQRKIVITFSLKNEMYQPDIYEEAESYISNDVSLQGLLEVLKSTMECYKRYAVQAGDFLICKKCGYKQYDEYTVMQTKLQHPKAAAHDIPYYCGACQDTATDDEYAAMQSEMSTELSGDE